MAERYFEGQDATTICWMFNESNMRSPSATFDKGRSSNNHEKDAETDGDGEYFACEWQSSTPTITYSNYTSNKRPLNPNNNNKHNDNLSFFLAHQKMRKFYINDEDDDDDESVTNGNENGSVSDSSDDLYLEDNTSSSDEDYFFDPLPTPTATTTTSTNTSSAPTKTTSSPTPKELSSMTGFFPVSIVTSSTTAKNSSKTTTTTKNITAPSSAATTPTIRDRPQLLLRRCDTKCSSGLNEWFAGKLTH